MMARHTLTAAALALSVVCGPAFADSVRVIDGDTIELAGQRIRLWGIDAPEQSQTCEGKPGTGLLFMWKGGQTYQCGRDATAVMVELTRGKDVTCEQRDIDRYRRIVAVCRTDAGELNAAMVRRGWAIDYTHYSKGRYKPEEAAAKAEHLGIWAGRFEMPEDFRRKRR